jgi:hypothetical protein
MLALMLVKITLANDKHPGQIELGPQVAKEE